MKDTQATPYRRSLFSRKAQKCSSLAFMRMLCVKFIESIDTLLMMINKVDVFLLLLFFFSHTLPKNSSSGKRSARTFCAFLFYFFAITL